MSDSTIQLLDENSRLANKVRILESEMGDLRAQLERAKHNVEVANTDLVMAKKHNDEIMKAYNDLVKEKSNVQNEKELIKKLSLLEEELNKYRSEKLNSNSSKDRMTAIRTTGVTKALQLTSTIESKKHELSHEEEVRPKSYSMLKNPKLFNEQDQKEIANLKTEIIKGKLSEDKVLTFLEEFIAKAVGKCNKSSLNSLQEIQKLVNQAEEEKLELFSQIENLEGEAATLRTKNAQLISKYDELSKERKRILELAEAETIKNIELESQLREVQRKTALEIENLKKTLEGDRKEHELKIKIFQKQSETAISERDTLQAKLKSALISKTSSEDVSKYQEMEITEANKKISKLTSEFISMQASIDKSSHKFKELELENSKLKFQLESQANSYLDEIEKLRIMYQKPNKRQTAVRSTNARGATNLMVPLSLNEDDFGMNLNDDFRHERLQVAELSADSNVNAADLLQEIAMKNKEMTNLREQVIELKEQMESSGKSKVKDIENELKKLKLEVAHSKENLDKAIANHAKEKKLLEDQLAKRAKEFSNSKNALNEEIFEKDSEVKKMKKQISLLTSQVGDLTKDIEKFNKKKK